MTLLTVDGVTAAFAAGVALGLVSRSLSILKRSERR